MAGSQNMTFLPGEDPGGYALGASHPEDLGRLAAYKLRMQRMPVGGDVAERFPWWRKVHDTVPAGEKIALLRVGWPATFVNSTDHIVNVEEIRFYTYWSAQKPLDYQTMLLTKVGIPPRKEIISDWMPVQTLHTEDDRMMTADVDTFTYELPAPYVLQRGNQFVMDWRYNAAFAGNFVPQNWIIMVGLHGYGLQDGEPISLMKAVRGWPNVGGVANQWQTVAFDEEQDRPMRDSVITHISFGSSVITNAATVLDGLEFRPHAPEGLEWHQSEFFCIRDVAEQVGRYEAADNWSIHRPIIPYILYPGEGVLVELWNRDTTDWDVDVILRGWHKKRG